MKLDFPIEIFDRAVEISCKNALKGNCNPLDVEVKDFIDMKSKLDLTTVPFFKLIYSNMIDRLDLRTLREVDMRQGWRPKRIYKLLSMLAIIFDLALVIIAVTLLLMPEADTRLKQVAVERILISSGLICMTTLEYYVPNRNCCKRNKS